MAVADLLASWDGEEVLTRHDPSTGATILICIHSTALGPAAGGTRMRVYATADDSLLDGLRLARAMTLKNATAGLPLGGGKAVLAVPRLPVGEERRHLLLHYGDILAELGGRYRTACDMHTTSEDMDVVAERCRYVFGRTVGAGGSGTSAPATAVGVDRAIRAALRFAFGSGDPGGRTIAIQGVGAVGALLAAQLADAGADVLVADVDGGGAPAVAGGVGARELAPSAILEADCDVLSPCATGGVLDAATIERLRCRIVAGAANNQLEHDRDGERFLDRGIVYVPDFVANAGGIIHLASLELLRESEAELDARLAAIGETTTAVLEDAAARGISTERAARAIADARIAAARR
ncbi:MAG: Glu/Leu/Phe/Val dehydrogenase dimerization domain-containing protein [Actinomycetota bacterium]